jgi:hypothetical protein
VIIGQDLVAELIEALPSEMRRHQKAIRVKPKPATWPKLAPSQWQNSDI